jgi:predicted transcriptional regulator
MGSPRSDDAFITLTADIVAAYVRNNHVSVNDLPRLIQAVHGTLSALSGSGEAAKKKLEPRVPICSSVTPHYLVCLEDGTIVRTLKRHLMTYHQMTPAQYRAKWELPAEYPMSAPSYSELRRSLAKGMGLGAKRKASGQRRK